MTDFPLKMAVHYQVTKTQLQELADRASRDDRGEMGSWLLMTAGLVAAAIAVIGILRPWFEDKARAITAN